MAGRIARRGMAPGLATPTFAVAALAIVFALLGACALPFTSQPGAQTVTFLDVLRTSDFPTNHVPPFSASIADTAKVQKLYNALVALPTMPPGTYCPADFGVEYHLTFFRDGASVATAIVKPDGCEGVSLTTSTGHWTRWAATSPRFWQQFADTLGVPESSLYVAPQPSGPSAPTPAPSN
ncbi:MAG TPA: hypothetical protein VIC85_07405 [Ktedonobacterales bacterium]